MTYLIICVFINFNYGTFSTPYIELELIRSHNQTEDNKCQSGK